MLQVAFIRENKETVLNGLAKRNLKNAVELVEKTIAADEDRRAIQTELDSILAESNKLSKDIGQLFKSGETQKAAILKEKTVLLKEKSKDLADSLQNKANELQELLYLIPNVPTEIVPAGVSADDNLNIFQKGEIPDDLKVEQEFITWAEHITFVHPVWWAGLPAMLKGYIDRVFSMGFAYAYTPEGPVGLLTGKSVSIVSTCGSPIELYEASGMARSISQVWNDGILKFCGLELIFYRLWGNVIQADSDERQKMLEETNKLVTTHCRAGRIE